MPHLVALLGDPVAHSRSPQLHNAAFAAAGLDWRYVACRVARKAVGDAVAGLRALGFAGANVTVPHKEAVVPHLDALTERAEGVGAVNTILVEAQGDGAARLVGDNTDVAGFLGPLRAEREQAPPLADRLRGGEVVVFGAGGAARAVVYAALTELDPTFVTITARTMDRAGLLASEMDRFDQTGALRVIGPDAVAEHVRDAALLVNATPLGMHTAGSRAYETATPWPHASDFRPGQIAYDLVYAPAATRFLKDAAERGATPVGGMPMLIGQAADAFERWTGVPWPLARDTFPDSV